MRIVTLNYISCECTACGEQTACTILEGDQLSMKRASVVALGAAGWKFITRDDDDDEVDVGWVCGGCYAAIERIPGGRGA